MLVLGFSELWLFCSKGLKKIYNFEVLDLISSLFSYIFLSTNWSLTVFSEATKDLEFLHFCQVVDLTHLSLWRFVAGEMMMVSGFLWIKSINFLPFGPFLVFFLVFSSECRDHCSFFRILVCRENMKIFVLPLFSL